MLNSLSEYIEDERQLRKLAIQGLKMDDRIVTRRIRDNRAEFGIAVLNILKAWRKDVDDDKPHSILCKALEETDMSYYMEKTLKK